jgi:hypothetical protein
VPQPTALAREQQNQGEAPVPSYNLFNMDYIVTLKFGTKNRNKYTHAKTVPPPSGHYHDLLIPQKEDFIQHSFTSQITHINIQRRLYGTQKFRSRLCDRESDDSDPLCSFLKDSLHKSATCSTSLFLRHFPFMDSLTCDIFCTTCDKLCATL